MVLAQWWRLLLVAAGSRQWLDFDGFWLKVMVFGQNGEILIILEGGGG